MAFPAPAGPASTSLPLPDPEAYQGEPREYARALMQRKDDIEKEMDALKDVLASHGTNASTPLVDPEGYPRGDIDVYAIRHARSALARLTTDRQTVNGLLSSALEAAFSAPSSSSSSAPQATPGTLTNGDSRSSGNVNGNARNAVTSRHGDDMPDQWPENPIARVNSVAPGSPAAQAGLQPGDVIYSFSDITSSSLSPRAGGLQAIGSLVQRSEGVTLTILALRDTQRVRLRLTPRTGWGGRGTLGCHILPA